MEIKRIDAAYRALSIKEFVDWAIENKYPYFIVIEGNTERGFVKNRKGTKMYRFNYKRY